MPLGLDIKSIILGIFLALYVYPFIMTRMSRSRVAPTATV